MAKRLRFEELFGTGFRWPHDGDDPFDLPDENQQQVTVAADDFSRFFLMRDGYRKSADALVQQAIEDFREADYLVFPIVFLYRHALELNLKYIINHYGHHVGIDPIWNTHEFERLWPKFLEVLDGFGTLDPDQADRIVGGIIAEFGNLDPRSFSFRYPRDNQGTPVPLAKDRLDLIRLKDVMDGVFGYFSGTDGYLSDLVNA